MMKGRAEVEEVGSGYLCTHKMTKKQQCLRIDFALVDPGETFAPWKDKVIKLAKNNNYDLIYDLIYLTQMSMKCHYNLIFQ